MSRRKGNLAYYERKPIPPKVRVSVIVRDGRRCQLCGRGIEDGVKLHVDHIFPVAKGGTNDIENLQTLCQECNSGKSDKVYNFSTMQRQQKQSDCLIMQMILKTLSVKISDFSYEKACRLLDLGVKTYGSDFLKFIRKLAGNLETGTTFLVFEHFYAQLALNMEPLAVTLEKPKKTRCRLYSRGNT